MTHSCPTLLSSDLRSYAHVHRLRHRHCCRRTVGRLLGLLAAAPGPVRRGAPGGIRRPTDLVDTAGNRKGARSEEHTSELRSLMRISYAVICLTKKNDKRHATLIITRYLIRN